MTIEEAIEILNSNRLMRCDDWESRRKNGQEFLFSESKEQEYGPGSGSFPAEKALVYADWLLSGRPITIYPRHGAPIIVYPVR